MKKDKKLWTTNRSSPIESFLGKTTLFINKLFPLLPSKLFLTLLAPYSKWCKNPKGFSKIQCFGFQYKVKGISSSRWISLPTKSLKLKKIELLDVLVIKHHAVSFTSFLLQNHYSGKITLLTLHCFSCFLWNLVRKVKTVLSFRKAQSYKCN